MSLMIVQDNLSVKLNLYHIGKYIDKVPPFITETLKNSGWECGHCNGKCAGGFAFELDGRSYNKCRCGSFLFNNTSSDAVPYCKALLENELSYEG